MPDESQDIQSLIDSGRRFHQQGDHYRALLEYRKAFVLAMASANSSWMPLLYWLLAVSIATAMNITAPRRCWQRLWPCFQAWRRNQRLSA